MVSDEESRGSVRNFASEVARVCSCHYRNADDENIASIYVASRPALSWMYLMGSAYSDGNFRANQSVA